MQIMVRGGTSLQDKLAKVQQANDILAQQLKDKNAALKEANEYSTSLWDEHTKATREAAQDHQKVVEVHRRHPPIFPKAECP